MFDFCNNVLQGRRWDRCIAECVFRPQEQTWQIVRERKDKGSPNHRSVFEKVWKSITDGIDIDEVCHLAEKGFEESAPQYSGVQGSASPQQ